MRFSGVNSFLLTCKELEKGGLVPLFKYCEVRQYFKDLNIPIANLETQFYFDDSKDVLSIIFYDNKGRDVLILELSKGNKYEAW